MAKSIVQRISLEGGAAIKAQLEAIGAAGSKAFSQFQGAVTSNRAFGAIGDAIESVKAKAAQLSGGARQLGNDMGALGGAVTKTASIFGVTFVGSLTGAAAAIAKLATGSADVGTNVQKQADAVGTSTDNLQKLTSVAGRFGVDGDAIAKVLVRINSLAGEQSTKDLQLEQAQANLRREFARGEIGFESYQKSLRDIREKADDSIDIFSRLGVSVKNSDGSVRDSVAIFNDVRDALAAIPDKAERAQLALQVSGAKNTGINRIFDASATSIRSIGDAVEKAEPKLSQFQIQVGNNLTVALTGLRGTINSLKNSIGLLFAPAETQLVDAFRDRIVAVRGQLIDMAADIAAKVGPVVDDLIAVLQGRDKDVKNTIILVIRDGIVQFASDVKNAVTNIILPALAALLKVLDTVAKAINGLFGTKLTGSELAIAVVIANAIGVFGIFTTAVKLALTAIGLLVTALGGAVPAAIAAVAFAVGFILVRALQSINWKGIADSAIAAWNAITSSVASVRGAIVAAFNTAINFVVGAWNGVLNFFAGIGTAIGGFFNDAAILVSNAFNTSVQFIADLWNELVNFFASLPATIGGFFVSVGNAIVSAFQSAVDTVKQFFQDLWSKVTGIFNDIIAKAKQVVNAVKSAVGLGNGSDKSAPGFAGGGPVRGPGTARSDSILARLSNGEFVMRVAAVNKWGIGVMSALNAGINPFRGFNAGGLVDALSPRRMGLPAFADGGLAVADASGGGSPVHLHIGGESLGPLFGDDAVINAVKRVAIRSKMRSAGRKPGFVGV